MRNSFNFQMKAVFFAFLIFTLSSCCSCPSPKYVKDNATNSGFSEKSWSNPTKTQTQEPETQNLVPYRDNDEDYFYPLYYYDN